MELNQKSFVVLCYFMSCVILIEFGFKIEKIILVKAIKFF